MNRVNLEDKTPRSHTLTDGVEKGREGKYGGKIDRIGVCLCYSRNAKTKAREYIKNMSRKLFMEPSSRQINAFLVHMPSSWGLTSAGKREQIDSFSIT